MSSFFKKLLDPAGIFSGRSGSPASSIAAATSAAQAEAGGQATTGVPQPYDANPSDPTYGTYTKPFDVEQFYNYADPGYAFQLQQGNQALQNSAAAGSGALSGAALKDLMKYNQDYSGTAYGDAFNRYQTQQGNIWNRLMGVAQLGQGSAAGVGVQGTNLAGQAGQAISNAGAASGAGIVGAGNAASNGLTNYWLMKNYQAPPPVLAVP